MQKYFTLNARHGDFTAQQAPLDRHSSDGKSAPEICAMGARRLNFADLYGRMRAKTLFPVDLVSINSQIPSRGRRGLGGCPRVGVPVGKEGLRAEGKGGGCRDTDEPQLLVWRLDSSREP